MRTRRDTAKPRHRQACRFSPHLVACAVLGAACAPSVSPRLPELFAQARRSEIQTIAKYREETLELSGMVLEVGVRKIRRETAHMVNRTSARAGQQTVAYPYIYLHDPFEAPNDRVLSYFVPDEIEDVAALQVGQPVTTRCRFQEIAKRQRHIEVVLKHCRLLD